MSALILVLVVLPVCFCFVLAGPRFSCCKIAGNDSIVSVDGRCELIVVTRVRAFRLSVLVQMNGGM